MREELTIHLIFAAAMAIALAAGIKWEKETDKGQRYTPWLAGWLMPTYLLGMLLVTLLVNGGQGAAELTLDWGVGMLLHIAVYNLLLLPLLPLLRRYISAGACAMLWLVPNYLYLMQSVKIREPLWVFSVPGKWLWLAWGVWVAGFVLVMVWKIVAHLLFRRKVLRHAQSVTDPEILAVWQQEVADARMKGYLATPVISSQVKTPLSIGLYRRTIRVVLPHRSYTPRELQLIFRHELIHIGRDDAWSKFFLVFCTAANWFNPLMWVAMRKSADDLELSCDETLLLTEDEAARQQYARLLLKTAGDERGFTTCLSASAQALRYRLSRVVQPSRRRSGAAVVGLTFFLLCMTYGYVAVSYGDGTGDQLIYQGQDPQATTLSYMTREDDPFRSTLICRDEAGLEAYLSGLSMQHITGNYSFSPQEGERQMVLLFDTPRGRVGAAMTEHHILLTYFYDDGRQASYYLPQGLDWQRMDQYIYTCPAATAVLAGEGVAYEMEVGSTLQRMTENGETVYQTEDEPGGIYGCEKPRQARLEFSVTPEGSYTVEGVSWDGSRTLLHETLQGDETFSLPNESARYTVTARFPAPDGGTYEAQFGFEVQYA